MSAVRLYARSRFRRRRVGIVVFAMLIAIAGGAVLAAFAGATRTASAASRLMARGKVDDIEIDPANFAAMNDLAKIRRLPDVADASLLGGAAVCVRPCAANMPAADTIGVVASPDGGFGRTMDIVSRLPHFTGREPRADRADEILVNRTAARDLHLHLGSVLHVAVLDFLPHGRVSQTAVDLKVVAIAPSPDELISNQNEDDSFILGTRAFARRFVLHSQFGFLKVRLRHGTRGIRPFEAGLRRTFPGQPFDEQTTQRQVSVFGRAVRPYTDALDAFGIVAAITALVVIGQAAGRLVRTDSSDGPVLRAIGASRTQRSAMAVVRSLGAIVAGSMSALLIAWLLSPLFPLGIARRVEPAPGFRFDALLLVVGVVVIVALFAVMVAVAAWVVNGDKPVDAAAGRRGSLVVDTASRSGAPASAVAGLQFAFQPDRTRPGGSTFATVFGLVVAIATTGAALTFGTNLDRFVNTPAQYGWTWGALLQPNNFVFSSAQIARVRSDPEVDGLTVGTYGDLTLDDEAVPAYGLRAERGHALPVATHGRIPAAPGEVALGAQTMRALHTSVGATIGTTTVDGGKMSLRVVGETLLPSLARNNVLGVGEGAVVTSATLNRLQPSVRGEADFLLADLAPGATIAGVRARERDIASIVGPAQPGDIRSYDQVHTTPLLLAGLLALLGVGVLAQMLVASVRSRRADLAILKSLGFTRRQVSATVAWEATALAAAALVVGVPLGALAGVWSWRIFEHNLGATAPPMFVPIAFVAIVLATFALANAIAAIPARTAADTRPATLLASE